MKQPTAHALDRPDRITRRLCAALGLYVCAVLVAAVVALFIP